MSGQQINLTQLFGTFQFIDTNKDDSVSFNELRSACEKLRMPVEAKKFKDRFQHRQNISFDDFCCIIQDFASLSDNAYFQETLRALDKIPMDHNSKRNLKKR